MTQPKLEVGKKYEIYGHNAIYKYIGPDDDNYIFVSDTDIPCQFHKSILEKFYITEHIEEPMKHTQFTVGDRVRIYDSGTGKLTGTGRVLCTPADNLVDINVDGEGKALISANLLRKITEEPMKEEVKLEIGKKYNIKTGKDNPYIYFGSLEDCGFGGKAHPYFFVDNQGDLNGWTEDVIEGITEHRELIKNSVEGWVNYDPYDERLFDLLDVLTGKHIWADEVYKTKREAIKDCESAQKPLKQIYCRITFEQLPEPTEESK